MEAFTVFDALEEEQELQEYLAQQKKVRFVKRGLFVLALLLILVLASTLQLRHVRVLGNSAYDAAQAEALVFDSPLERSVFAVLFREQTGRKKSIPFVSSYHVKLTGPDSCDLIFYEKLPVGCVEYMSNYVYFDKDGTIIESTPEKMEGVPEIRGIRCGNVVRGNRIGIGEGSQLEEIMNITGQLQLHSIVCEYIRFDSMKNADIYLPGEDLSVKLGGDRDMSAKISALNDMLPGIRERGLAGELDLSSFQDKKKENAVSLRLKERQD